MLKSLYKLPKWFLAMVFIGVGIGVILLQNPPHHFCETEVNNFKEKNKAFLFLEQRFDNLGWVAVEGFSQPKKRVKDKEVKWELGFLKLQSICRKTNSPGGCYELFSYLRKLNKSFFLVSQDCTSFMIEMSLIKDSLVQGLEIMTSLAFRKKALLHQAKKWNWLGESDLYLFCSLKDKVIHFYGRRYFKSLETDWIQKLGEENSLPQEIVRKNSLLHLNCSLYRSSV